MQPVLCMAGSIPPEQDYHPDFDEKQLAVYTSNYI